MWLVLAAAGAGAVIGYFLAVRSNRRSSRTGTDLTPSVPPAHDIAWRDAVDDLQTGVMILNAGGGVRYRNAAAGMLTGTHLGVLIDHTVTELADRARLGSLSQQTLELYGPPRTALHLHARPLPTGDIAVTIEDISERRRVDTVRADFVANVSHELKTPIGALAVLAETLIGTDELEIAERVTTRMVDQSHRVTSTIDDLLELSRIEFGELPGRDPLLVDDIFQDAVIRVRHLADTRAITITTPHDGGELRVLGDRRQLASAVGNLVENAVKYSEVGATVELGVRSDGDTVDLIVTDHGIGIPADKQTRVFERFYRIDKARGRSTGGTGLGLSVVRHIATIHGGHLLLSSQEGEGSTFTLRLPAMTATERLPAP